MYSELIAAVSGSPTHAQRGRQAGAEKGEKFPFNAAGERQQKCTRQNLTRERARAGHATRRQQQAIMVVVPREYSKRRTRV